MLRACPRSCSLSLASQIPACPCSAPSWPVWLQAAPAASLPVGGTGHTRRQRRPATSATLCLHAHIILVSHCMPHSQRWSQQDHTCSCKGHGSQTFKSTNLYISRQDGLHRVSNTCNGNLAPLIGPVLVQFEERLLV